MHRGSSKDARNPPRVPESLPLSASPATVAVLVEVTRGASVERHELTVVPGTLVRVALRSLGHSPEGCAVLIDDVPIPLDAPIDRPTHLTVVPTFSGG
jgi:sulfur carrier protein ThiS